MAFQSDNRVLQAVVLCSLGLVLVGGAVAIGFTDWTGTHRHVTEVVAESSDTRETVLFEELTATEQDLVQETIEAEGAVWTTGPAMEQFGYAAGPDPPNTQFIEYQGEIYELSIKEESRELAVRARAVQAGLGLSGLVAVFLGLAIGSNLSRRVPESHTARVEALTARILPVALFSLLWFTLSPTLVRELNALVPELPGAPVTSFLSSLLVLAGLAALSTRWVLQQVDISFGQAVATVVIVAMGRILLQIWAMVGVLVVEDIVFNLIAMAVVVGIVLHGFALGRWLHVRRLSSSH
jgi:hypothetical protein